MVVANLLPSLFSAFPHSNFHYFEQLKLQSEAELSGLLPGSGSGEGNFTTVDAVQRPDLTPIYPNVTVKIYRTEKMEQPVESIEVDRKGNFYTTTPVDWGRLMGFSYQRQ